MICYRIIAVAFFFLSYFHFICINITRFCLQDNHYFLKLPSDVLKTINLYQGKYEYSVLLVLSLIIHSVF